MPIANNSRRIVAYFDHECEELCQHYTFAIEAICTKGREPTLYEHCGIAPHPGEPPECHVVNIDCVEAKADVPDGDLQCTMLLTMDSAKSIAKWFDGEVQRLSWLQKDVEKACFKVAEQ